MREDEKDFFHAEIDYTTKFYAWYVSTIRQIAGLHVGHPRSFTARMDVVSRKRRQNGYNVLYPLGWDAFGHRASP